MQVKCNVQVLRPEILLLLVVEGAQGWVVAWSHTTPLGTDLLLVVTQFSWIVCFLRACLFITALLLLPLILYLSDYISHSLLDFKVLEEREYDFQPESSPIMCSQEMLGWKKYIRTTKKQLCTKISYNKSVIDLNKGHLHLQQVEWV